MITFKFFLFIATILSFVTAEVTLDVAFDNTIGNYYNDTIENIHNTKSNKIEKDINIDTNITPMSELIITELQSSLYFNQYENISDIFEGTALDIPKDNLKEAICKFRSFNKIFSSHFPHVMQQLYRCWSWWELNKNIQPILVMGTKSKDFQDDFTNSYLEVLQKNYKLIIKENNYTVTNGTAPPPYVQVKNTGKWLDDIEITDFAMIHPQDTTNLKYIFKPYINNTNYKPGGCENNINPKISIINRLTESGRSIINANELAISLHENFPNNSIAITYFEKKTFYGQIQYFMESDIIISPHGAQLTGLLFMPNNNINYTNNDSCSTVLEFLPKEYLVADFFGSLAKASGVRHTFYYMSNDNITLTIPNEKKYHYFKSAWYKENNMYLNITAIIDTVSLLIDNWKICCKNNNYNVG